MCLHPPTHLLTHLLTLPAYIKRHFSGILSTIVNIITRRKKVGGGRVLGSVRLFRLDANMPAADYLNPSPLTHSQDIHPLPLVPHSPHPPWHAGRPRTAPSETPPQRPTSKDRLQRLRPQAIFGQISLCSPLSLCAEISLCSPLSLYACNPHTYLYDRSLSQHFHDTALDASCQVHVSPAVARAVHVSRERRSSQVDRFGALLLLSCWLH